MGEWIIGAFINLFGSIAINFGTNLLKLGHDEVLLAPLPHPLLPSPSLWDISGMGTGHMTLPGHCNTLVFKKCMNDV